MSPVHIIVRQNRCVPLPTGGANGSDIRCSNHRECHTHISLVSTVWWGLQCVLTGVERCEYSVEIADPVRRDEVRVVVHAVLSAQAVSETPLEIQFVASLARVLTQYSAPSLYSCSMTQLDASTMDFDWHLTVLIESPGICWFAWRSSASIDSMADFL